MKLHPASRAMLLSMLIATFFVAGCAPEADGGAEPVDQVDVLGAAAAALPDAAAAREDTAAKPAAAVRSAIVPCARDVDSALVISEIMYNPASPTAAEIVAGYADNDDFEFVELTNIAMLFLLAVLIVAVNLGRGPAVAAAFTGSSRGRTSPPKKTAS